MMKLTAMILLEVNALLNGAPVERPKLWTDGFASPNTDNKTTSSWVKAKKKISQA